MGSGEGEFGGGGLRGLSLRDRPSRQSLDLTPNPSPSPQKSARCSLNRAKERGTGLEFPLAQREIRVAEARNHRDDIGRQKDHPAPTKDDSSNFAPGIIGSLKLVILTTCPRIAIGKLVSTMKKVMIFALISSFSAAHAVVLIDDFTSGFSSLVDTTPGVNVKNSFQTGLSNFGGTRAHFLSQNTAPISGGVSTSQVNGGLFGTNTPGCVSTTRVHWGEDRIIGDNGAISNDNNWDFSSNRIFRVFVSSASASTQIRIILEDISFATTTSTIALDAITLGSAITTPTVLTFDFTDSPTVIQPGFNFGAVDSITLSIGSPQSGGYAINRVEAVPEPATMSALLLGAGMLVRRRRAGK
jgi:hypothetical protein